MHHSSINALGSAVKTKPLTWVLLTAVSIGALLAGANASDLVPKGYQANENIQTDTPALLGRFGELIARERAYQQAVQELVSSTRGSSTFTLDDSVLSEVLGDDYRALYDEILPRLEALGENSRIDEIALRFDQDVQKKLKAGDRVAGINAGAVNNFIAHYKIAIEKLDTEVRQLLLAESHLVRRAADETSMAIQESGEMISFVHYARASHLLSAPRQVKGFVQPRCNREGDAIKRSRDLRNDIEDNFYFDGAKKLQISAQAIYNAAELIEEEAMRLNEDGSHC